VTAAPKLSSEFETDRALAARIREPMGAVRLAVQILAGPMARALDQLDEVTRARVQSVLQTLEQSTKQVCDVLAGFPVTDAQAPAANGPLLPKSGTASPKPAAPRASAWVAANGPMRAAGPRNVDVDDLLRKLEIVTVTRSALPVMLSVDAHAGLQAVDAGRELLPTIVALVERATRDSAEARPHARPWTVEVRAFVDPAEILGDEMHVVIEVRHDGTAVRREVIAWLEGSGVEPSAEPALVAAKAVAEAAGGRIEVLGAGTKTAVRVRLPESRA
jgi:hypothetical protein